MAFEGTYTEPYYTGTATSSLVPRVYPVAIGGHPYMIDTKVAEQGQFFQESVPYIPRYAFYTGALGEDTLNPEPAWRESIRSWDSGAGQVHYDLLTSVAAGTLSDPFRFRSSKGIDPWTQGQFSLLPDTTVGSAFVSANTNQAAVVAGTYLYWANGTELYWTTDYVTKTAAAIAAGASAQTVGSIASDGFTVYACQGANGIHTTTRGATTSTASYTNPGAGAYTLVAYVKGRIMAAALNAIYNITATGAAPTAAFTHPNADFRWVSFTEGQLAIYAAGYSGDKSEIHSLTIKADGSGLNGAIVAARLPSGEVVQSIRGYLGFIAIGTNNGVRFAVETSNGLSIGALIKTGTAVRCLEGQDRFIYFGWENYDSSSTGLGRMDLTTINPGNAPAYASDLMATAQGAVSSVVTFGGKQYFTVQGAGLYAQSANLVASGQIDSGLTTMKLQDVKVPLVIEVRRDLTNGTHAVWLDVDGAGFSNLGQHDQTTFSPTYQIGAGRGQSLEVRHVLGRGTDTTKGPIIFESTLFALPVPPPGDSFTVPIRLQEVDRVGDGGPRLARSVSDEARFLYGLRATQTPVIYQEGDATYRVVVASIKRLKLKPTANNLAWAGTVLVTMKTINTPNG